MKVISLRIFKPFSEVNRRGFFKEGFSKFLLGLFKGISCTYRKDFFLERGIFYDSKKSLDMTS